MRTANGESVLSRVVRIVETFGSDTPALRVTDIARRTGLHVATVSRLVDELVRHGWLHRDPDRTVCIGVRMWEVASRASSTLPLHEAALPFMADLHAVIGHHVQLGVRQEHEVLFVERLSAPGAVINYTRIAGRLPLHASSSGLVLLAHAPADVQEAVLGEPRHRYTRNTVTDPKRLRVLLADVRRNGYSFCPGFIDVAATGIAVPLRGKDNAVVAALSAIVPNDRNARMPIPALRAAARGISRIISQ
ncbi:MAG TPA: IclR family transcriptional regulator [Pseudonocardiaceae bacterium]|nr:IclR family transcriptional regulator [Pseudonocardiaceae bacterium]